MTFEQQTPSNSVFMGISRTTWLEDSWQKPGKAKQDAKARQEDDAATTWTPTVCEIKAFEACLGGFA